jgi:SAM-dependent methyltransferase
VSDELQKEYARRFEQMAPYRVAVWKILTRDFFSRWIPESSVVLDLGCGWGEFINQVVARQKYGMDLNPDSPAKMAKDVAFLSQDCAERWKLSDASLDVVFTSNFFEHLPSKDRLRHSLDQAFRCLKPGGLLICLGPNIKFLAGRYWDFWDHFLPLTELSLKEVLELVGFEIEFLKDRFLPYSMSLGFAPSPFLIKIYLSCPILWPLAGKQFLIVARKPLIP